MCRSYRPAAQGEKRGQAELRHLFFRNRGVTRQFYFAGANISEILQADGCSQNCAPQASRGAGRANAAVLRPEDWGVAAADRPVGDRARGHHPAHPGKDLPRPAHHALPTLRRHRHPPQKEVSWLFSILLKRFPIRNHNPSNAFRRHRFRFTTLGPESRPAICCAASRNRGQGIQVGLQAFRISAGLTRGRYHVEKGDSV